MKLTLTALIFALGLQTVVHAASDTALNSVDSPELSSSEYNSEPPLDDNSESLFKDLTVQAVPDSPTPNEDVVLKYRADDSIDFKLPNVDVEKVPTESLYQMLEADLLVMQTKAYQQTFKEVVWIPGSTTKPELLEKFKRLSPAEQRHFLIKKYNFLNKTSKFLRVLRFPNRATNKVIHQLNDLMFSGIGANSYQNTFTIGTSAGIGLPLFMTSRLKKIHRLRNMPVNIGFYVLFAFGISTRIYKVNGRLKVKVEPLFETRYARKSLSPYVFVDAGVHLTQYIGKMDLPPKAVEVHDITLASFLLKVKTDKVTGLGLSLVIGFPPGGGTAIYVEGKGTRYFMSREAIATLRNRIERYFGLTSRGSCAKIF